VTSGATTLIAQVIDFASGMPVSGIAVSICYFSDMACAGDSMQPCAQGCRQVDGTAQPVVHAAMAAS
jgi:hypothetical protein